MYVSEIERHEPANLGQAAELMQRFAPDARYLAGGTDLLVDLKTGRFSVAHVISLKRIDELRGVTETDGGVRIGALTTITQLSRSPIIRDRFAPTLDATRVMAAPQIRNVATVGGNVAGAVACADLPPIFTVMNATVQLWSSAGARELPIEKFYRGARSSVLRDGELISAVFVPDPPAGFGAAYARFGLREGNAIAVASVAAALVLNGNGTIKTARIALGAVAPTPVLVESAAAALIGSAPDESVFEHAAGEAQKAAKPISDIRASAEYRRELIGVLARRALHAACSRAREAGA